MSTLCRFVRDPGHTDRAASLGCPVDRRLVGLDEVVRHPDYDVKLVAARFPGKADQTDLVVKIAQDMVNAKLGVGAGDISIIAPYRAIVATAKADSSVNSSKLTTVTRAVKADLAIVKR